MVKITYSGSERDIKQAANILKQLNLTRMKEPKARLKIQKIIDKYNLKATVLLDGNVVWSKKKILRNLDRIMKHGTLYNENQRKPPILSRYFYQFLTSCCGSVGHYDVYGWIHKYSTIEHLKKFFKKNEFDKRVLDDIPEWQTDAIEIIKAIEQKLFPFQSFLKSKNK